MASIRFITSKKGVLVAKIQIYGKDPATGSAKLYHKSYRNKEGLTEAKFKKKMRKVADELEENILTAYKDQMSYIHTGVLTFSQLSQEWITGITANLSHNYYLRAKEVSALFNNFLKSINLDKSPISDIRVRDVQLFINSFSTGYTRGKPIAKLKKPLPDNVSFRELAREDIITRCSSYKMNKLHAKIYLETAETICERYDLKFDDYFENVTKVNHYSPETIKGYRRILRTIFNEAVRYEWITKNPVCSTKIGASKGNDTLRPIEEKEVFSIKESQDFIKMLNELPEELIYKKMPIKIMLLTGLRLGEICGLRWSDIDLEKGVLHVNRNRLVSKEKGIYEKEPKTKTSKRTVPMPKALISDLKEYAKWFEKADVNFRRKLNQYYLAVNIYREPIYPHSLGCWLRKLEVDNGFKQISCHGLRHTYCSILLAKRVPIQTISRYMGHSESTITLEVYSHFIPDTEESAINALDSIT